MRPLILTFFFFVFLIGCVYQTDHSGGRVKLNQETNEPIPLNKEAGMFLAYDNLIKGDATKAEENLKLCQNLESSQNTIELQEAIKTLYILVLISKKDYTEASKKIDLLETVEAFPLTSDNGEIKYQSQYRKIRSANIQLKKSNSALKSFLNTDSKSFSQSWYKKLKSQWFVQLCYIDANKIRAIDYSFPDFPKK